MDLVALGKSIQATREAKKMSQEQLAAAIGCSQATISNYEKGKRRIYLPHIEKLATALETPVSFFLEQANETEPVDSVFKQPFDDSPVESYNNAVLAIIERLYNLSYDELIDIKDYINYIKWKKEGDK